MNVLKDEWSGLFSELESRVSAQGRTRLLFQLIGDVQDVTMLNFGATGLARPEEWSSLTSSYAREFHDGNTTPTLILSGELLNGFVHEVTSEYATLTNTVTYATDHQFGVAYRNLPARPFYPVDESGASFTSFMEDRLLAIVDSHFSV